MRLCVPFGMMISRDLGFQIDWEESSNAARVCVRPHVDAELDDWKRIFHGLGSVLVLSLSSGIGSAVH